VGSNDVDQCMSIIQELYIIHVIGPVYGFDTGTLHLYTSFDQYVSVAQLLPSHPETSILLTLELYSGHISKNRCDRLTLFLNNLENACKHD
jgi:hypothetical protein